MSEQIPDLQIPNPKISKPQWMDEQENILAGKTVPFGPPPDRRPTREQVAIEQLQKDAFREQVKQITPNITEPKDIDLATINKIVEKIKSI